MFTPPLPDIEVNHSAQSAIYIQAQAPVTEKVGEYKIVNPLSLENVIKQAIQRDGYKVKEYFKEKDDGDIYLLYTLDNIQDDFNPIAYAIDLGNKLGDVIPENVYVNIL